MPIPKVPGFYGFTHINKDGYEMISVIRYSNNLFFNFEGTIHNIIEFHGSAYTDIINIEDAIKYIDENK